MAKILVVDDAAFMRKVIRDTLTKNGYTDVHEAVDGKDAVEKYFELHPNLVLMDITMQNMDGLEALKAIRAKDSSANVVMCSAMGQEAMVMEAVQAGIKDFIVKPFQISLLKASFRNLLSLREKMKTMYGETFSLKQFGVEEPKEHDDFLTRYIEIVKANISNPELDVSVIYEALGMSRTNFYRKVKTVTGLSPIELIKNIRLEAGAKLLKESDMNISEIAQHIGVSSRSYFARSFKAVYGMSPTEYQETKSQD